MKIHRIVAWTTLLVLAELTACREQTANFVDRPRMAAGVRMEDVTLQSAALNRQTTYRVYLPETIAPSERLPVVYLLHGSGSNFRDWSNNSDVAQWAATEKSGGMILVMPDGDSSYWMNAVGGGKERYEDFLLKDLPASVAAKFPAAQGREKTAIVGVSMGGFASIRLALARPELFGFAGAISPAVDVPQRKFSWKRWAQSWRYQQIFGPVGSATRQAADPFLLVPAADPAKTPLIYLTAGKQEPLFQPIRSFDGKLNKYGFQNRFIENPGGHTWTRWVGEVDGCFKALQSSLSLRAPEPQTSQQSKVRK